MIPRSQPWWFPLSCHVSRCFIQHPRQGTPYPLSHKMLVCLGVRFPGWKAIHQLSLIRKEEMEDKLLRLLVTCFLKWPYWKSTNWELIFHKTCCTSILSRTIYIDSHLTIYALLTKTMTRIVDLSIEIVCNACGNNRDILRKKRRIIEFITARWSTVIDWFFKIFSCWFLAKINFSISSI